MSLGTEEEGRHASPLHHAFRRVCIRRGWSGVLSSEATKRTVVVEAWVWGLQIGAARLAARSARNKTHERLS